MKKIIVTGCNGQLGRAINLELAGNPELEFVNTDVNELDITNIDEVLKLAREVKPYAIINCAAHTAVDACETDVDNAYRINAIGPRNLSIAATQTGAKMVHISTDYVFNGKSDHPYIEFDTPNPQGIYGKTKLQGENMVKQFADRFFIFRTAWLYGDGRNFVKTMLRLSETNDQVSVHATCEGSCSWADFAEEIFRLAGRNTKVNHITSEEFAAKAPRPSYSILENYMLKLTSDYRFADWHDAIESYIKGMK